MKPVDMNAMPAQMLPPAGGSGFRTLFYKELLRFWKVSFQTIAAPVLTALLYLVVFAQVLQNHVKVFGQIDYTAFLIPGLMMMSMLQNAFTNPASSLIQSRISGNLVFMLLPPISPQEIFWAYTLAGIVRGLVVGACVWVVASFFTPLVPAHLLWVVGFGVLSCGIMSSLGLIAGLCAEKFDQLAAFQNFLIMPATFLSGVFYSIETLPPFWKNVSHFNPIFYTIDGFRYGFFGLSDAPVWRSLAVVAAVFAVMAWLALRLLTSGYKLRT